MQLDVGELIRRWNPTTAASSAAVSPVLWMGRGPIGASVIVVRLRHFAILECELLNRRTFHTYVEARTAIFRSIEGWYNPHRRHSVLGLGIAGFRVAVADNSGRQGSRELPLDELLRRPEGKIVYLNIWCPGTRQPRHAAIAGMMDKIIIRLAPQLVVLLRSYAQGEAAA